MKQLLPLVEFCKSSFPNRDLSNILLIGVQHILPTTHLMLKSLIAEGLRPENISLLGKCYSTNPSTFKKMREEGIDISDFCNDFSAVTSFDTSFKKCVKSFVQHCKSKYNFDAYEKIIIIDDGGKLLSNLDIIPKRALKKTVGVEQTTYGYELLKREKPLMPVVNVARSPAKLIYESPLIANVIAKKLADYISEYQHEHSKTLIIGNGAVGSAYYSLMNDQTYVDCYDIDQTKSSLSEYDYQCHLHEYDVIIGATGTRLIKHSSELAKFKKGAILASASSSDIEFSGEIIRSLYHKEIHSCHDNITTETITLLNCGFPVNFSNDYDSVDPIEHQLTRSLLICAILQSLDCSSSDVGFVSLDFEVQREIIHKYLELFPHSRVNTVFAENPELVKAI